MTKIVLFIVAIACIENAVCAEGAPTRYPGNQRKQMEEKIERYPEANKSHQTCGEHKAAQGEYILTSRKSIKMLPDKFGLLEISGYSRIAADAFTSRSDIKVVIARGVSSIGDRAFSDCPNLKVITIEGDLEDVGIGVCYNCPELVVVGIPDSVKFINSMAFKKCPKLDIDNLMKKFTGTPFQVKLNKDMIPLDKRSQAIKEYHMKRMQLINNDKGYAEYEAMRTNED